MSNSKRIRRARQLVAKYQALHQKHGTRVTLWRLACARNTLAAIEDEEDGRLPLSIAAVARRLNITQKSVRDLIARGLLPEVLTLKTIEAHLAERLDGQTGPLPSQGPDAPQA